MDLMHKNTIYAAYSIPDISYLCFLIRYFRHRYFECRNTQSDHRFVCGHEGGLEKRKNTTRLIAIPQLLNAQKYLYNLADKVGQQVKSI